MTCVARRALGILPDGVWLCQPGTIRWPRHDWSMRVLGSTIAAKASGALRAMIVPLSQIPLSGDREQALSAGRHGLGVR